MLGLLLSLIATVQASTVIVRTGTIPAPVVHRCPTHEKIICSHYRAVYNDFKKGFTEIASGGFGKVLTVPQKPNIVIKVFFSIKGFVEEVDSYNNVNHGDISPNYQECNRVLRYYTACCNEAAPPLKYFLIEPHAGVSLYHLSILPQYRIKGTIDHAITRHVKYHLSTMEEFRQLPVCGLLSMLSQVAEALACLRQSDRTHLDIKLENVNIVVPAAKIAARKLDDDAIRRVDQMWDMAARDVADEDALLTASKRTGNLEALSSTAGDIYLIDLGLSQPVGGRVDRGTPGYKAPEMLLQTGVRPATDVFALGMTAIELITGEIPESSATTDVSDVRSWKPSVLRSFESYFEEQCGLTPEGQGLCRKMRHVILAMVAKEVRGHGPVLGMRRIDEPLILKERAVDPLLRLMKCREDGKPQLARWASENWNARMEYDAHGHLLVQEMALRQAAEDERVAKMYI